MNGCDKICILACHVLWREICWAASLSNNSFDIEFLPQGLHNTPDILRSNLQNAVDTADARTPKYKALLIGYGLCSRGIAGITARTVPLVVPRMHDCLTVFLGSKERYRSYFDSHPGTYWYTPGWIEDSLQPGKERMESMRKHYEETYGKENADYLISMEQNWYTHYSNVAYIDLGVGNNGKTAENYAKDCAEYLHWNFDSLKGDPTLLHAWINGPWDEKDFLTVLPGQTIESSDDERIIKIKEPKESL